MNAVEIEAAVAALAEEIFDRAEFPFRFLAAFGFKETTLKKLRKGASNPSDVGGVLLRNHIHLAVCEPGGTAAGLDALRASPKSAQSRVKFLFATDGEYFEAVQAASAEHVADALGNLANHFGFFLPLAGITTVKEIKDNPIDVRATGRLNKLYLELLKINPEWGSAARRHEMNHFMARLIFCFFAQNTGIFQGHWMFTDALQKFADVDGSNAHYVLGEIFRAMNLHPTKDRPGVEPRLPGWADQFPYVNGGLFGDSIETPQFNRIARSYLLEAGRLDWQKINPDIFGSMIQAVAEDEERGALGMHYTSVPNILKVLNPLFLDELRGQLEAAGTSAAKLRRLRTRLSRIRVFDPACGSGNFLVIAYKQMRSIEAEIDRRLGDQPKGSVISLKNFRGIEIRDFAAEIARLALVIAEYQCNVDHLGQQQAQLIFLPLASENWITYGNALRLDWLKICPPEGTGAKVELEDTLFQDEKEQRGIDFENEGGETFICGNPPYLGFTWQSGEQKQEIRALLPGKGSSSGFLDYVSGWFLKSSHYATHCASIAAFVTTNSICQGQSVPILWRELHEMGSEIRFAYTSMKWSNLASNKAGVTVAIIAIGPFSKTTKRLYTTEEDGSLQTREGQSITPYLTLGPWLIVSKTAAPHTELAVMEFGNKPSDGGNLLLRVKDIPNLGLSDSAERRFIRKIYGSEEFINGGIRYCLWIEDRHLDEALTFPSIRQRVEAVRDLRLASPDKGAHSLAKRAHQLKLMRIGTSHTIVVPSVSSEKRPYLPVGLVDERTTLTNLTFGLYDAPLWNMALIASKLHLTWIATVCGKLETRYRYSNTLGWNTFPVPALTERDKAELTRCAENILLARERHFPATIADLYVPEAMPDDLRAAHEANDETLERIYIGRRFRNDTERLETLFRMYTKMVAEQKSGFPAGRTTRKTKAKAKAKIKTETGAEAQGSLLEDEGSEVQA